MRIDIITLFPELLSSPFEDSILKRAIVSNLVEIKFHNLRDYTENKNKQVDDYQYGGGSGMVIKIEPIDRCISFLKNKINYDDLNGLSNEVKAKFKKIRPKTMGQALRIDGITPSAVYILLSHVKRKSIKHIA